MNWICAIFGHKLWRSAGWFTETTYTTSVCTRCGWKLSDD